MYDSLLYSTVFYSDDDITDLICLYTTYLQATPPSLTSPTSECIVLNRNNNRFSFLDLSSAESHSMTYRSGSFSYPLRSVAVGITI
jgi:hypothetical protein